MERAVSALETHEVSDMTATADLRSEHAGVGRMLGIMDSMAGRARAGGRLDVGDLEQAIEFLRVFVDQCHHTKEEELLFPAMRAANMTSAEETIVILLADHVEGRQAVTHIAAATRRLAESDDSASTDLAEAISGYTRLLHDHIRREENDCFRMADHELPAAVQEELAEGYERVEREVVGEGRHEAFQILLDRLSSEYR
jgi:hemerythrin-like domain-containing protein